MTYQKIVIIWENGIKIGYCNTYFEADDICKKKPDYSWSFAKNIDNNKNGLKFMTINDYLI